MWKSKGLFDKSIKPPAASNSFAPGLNHINTKIQVEYYENCLK